MFRHGGYYFHLTTKKTDASSNRTWNCTIQYIVARRIIHAVSYFLCNTVRLVSAPDTFMYILSYRVQKWMTLDGKRPKVVTAALQKKGIYYLPK